MLTVQMKPTGFFKPDPNNPRKCADEKDLDHLGDDLLARGVLVPLLARPGGILIDGWRRWLAAQRKGIKELPAIITDKPESEIPGIRLATVFHKADLTGAEKWLACSEILASHPGWQMKDLAEFLHLDPSMLTRLVSPSKCIPAWQEALKEGKVGISDCYAASKLPEPEQAGLLALKLGGASRDTLERHARTKRATSAPAVRVSKIKCQLGSGVSIVVSGVEMTLDEMIESLLEAAKEAKKARDQGLHVETFQRLMRDRARAN
jgi:ParB family chromosome partitioning protein